MIIFKDLLSGDELFSDSYPYTETDDGFFYEAQGRWVVVGDVDIDIGANPSAEGGDDETVDPSQKRVVDLEDAFRLQEQPQMGKKDFIAYCKQWCQKVLAALPEDQKADFQAKSQAGIKKLLGLIKDLQFFTGESLDPEGTMVYAYYPEGAENPTFLYPRFALKEEKC